MRARGPRDSGGGRRASARRRRLALALLAVAWAAVAWSGGYAEDQRRAIELVAAHPAFASGLAHEPGWTATAYDALDRYGLWRVDLASAEGRALGWAQVRLAASRVIAWETEFELEGVAYEAARERLMDALRRDEDFRALAGDPDEHEWSWVGYEAWRDAWVVYLERGTDSLHVVLRSAHDGMRSLDGLRVIQVQAVHLPAYTAWRDMQGAEAIARAFGDPAVAAAVRGVVGWTADAEPVDRRIWRVRFLDGARALVEAEVDVGRGTVVVRR